jgi:hypothetical protein
MTGSSVRAAFLAAAFLAGAGAAPALALEVSLSAQRTAVRVGEQFTVAVEVRGDGMGGLPKPELPAVENLRVVGRPYTSQGFEYVNGVARSTVTLQYVLIADAEGEYVIGPVHASKGDESATSGTVTVAVEPAGSTAAAPRRLGEEPAGSTDDGKDLIVLARVDDDRPYVNEQVQYTFTFLERADLLQLNYQRPSWDGFWAEDLDSTEPTEVMYEGRRYRAQRVRTALFPMAPGKLEIGPATLRVTVAERQRRSRDPFEVFGGRDPFNLFQRGREVVLTTDPVPIQVRPLPEDGKPRDFSGAVGTFTLTADADRYEVKAGEAVTLRVTLAGEGQVKGIPAPDLAVLDDFRIYQSRSDEKSEVLDGRIVSRKTWEFVLVPVTGGDVEIPAVRLGAFDPAAERYVELTTAAIPVRVEATDLEEALARGDDPSVAKERVRLQQRDIRYLKPAPERLRRAGGSPFGSPAFLLAHAVPVLALAGATLFRRHRDRLRSDVRYARRRGAAKTAGRRLRSAREALAGGDLTALFGELSGALRGYVADRLHLAAANLDDEEVRRGLAAAGLPDDAAEEVFGILSSCDSARYSPLGTDPAAAGELLKRGEEWIGRAERT